MATNQQVNIFGQKRIRYCSQCRVSGDDVSKMLRCSRCKVAHFCSQECQRAHHPVHKKLCKQLADTLIKLPSFAKQARIDDGSFVLCSPNFDETNWNDFIESSAFQDGYRLCKKEAGDLAFTIAYSACDTPERGAAELEVALRHYLEFLRVMPVDEFRVEELTAFLLVALNYDEHAYTFIRFYTMTSPEEGQFQCYFRFLQMFGQDENGWVYGNMRTLQIELAENRPLILNSLAFSVVLLLRSIKGLIRLRDPSNLEDSGQVTDTENETRYWVKNIDDKYPGFLYHLYNTIPLVNSDQYDLFHPTTPEWFWHLLQDCFFLTPGVNSILHEFANGH